MTLHHPPARLMPPLAATAALAALAIAVVALTLLPSDAEAHALLVRSDPPENSELQVPPDQVIGFFSEALDQRLSSLEVVDGTGERVDSGQTTFGPEPERMSTTIPENLEPGFYMVVWETLSSVDGHLFKGSYPFTVLNEDGSQPSGPMFEAGGGGSESTGVEDIAVKWLELLTSTTLVGALAFIVWVNGPATCASNTDFARTSRTAMRRRLRWIIIPAVVGLALAGGGEILLQADQLGGMKYVDDVLRNDWGERWIQRQILLGCIAIALTVSFIAWNADRRRLADTAVWISIASGFLYLFLIASVSHGAAVPGSFWGVANDFLHLASTAVWIGMLAMLTSLLLWLRTQPDGPDKSQVEAEHLHRFSSFAATSVVVLLATGTLSGLTQVPHIDDLIDTAYGRALSIKLGTIALLLAVASVNAFYLRPRLLDEADEGEATTSTVRTMRFAVLAEIGLAIGVILAAAALIQHTTARQVEQVEEARELAETPQFIVGFEEEQPAGDIDTILVISPNNVGQNSFRAFLYPRESDEIGEVLRVRLRFQPPDENLGVSDLVLDEAGPTVYSGVGPFLSAPGQWTVSLDVRRADIDDVSADYPVHVTSGPQTGGDFELPLTVGSWLTVAGLVALVLALLAAVWSPRLPEAAPQGLLRGARIASAAVIVIGITALAVSFLPSERTGNPIDLSPESIAVGRALFMQNCVQCHGVGGRGDGPLAGELPYPPPDYRQHIPYHQNQYFFNVMTNGRGDVMPPFGDILTEDERWHLLNYLQSEYSLEARQAENAGGETRSDETSETTPE